jgi:L-rhamnose-H+ transport protein
VVSNIFFAGLAGVIWAMQFVCQKVGEPAMGDLAYVGFAIVMGSAIFFSSLVGVLLGEWKGVGSRTKTLLVLGIVTLLVSFSVMSYGYKLTEQSKLPEVQAERAVQDALNAVRRMQNP